MKLTLNKIRSHGPCGMDPRAVPLTGFCKLREYLGSGFDPDQEFSLVAVLDSNGLDDAHWCLRAVEGREKEIKKYVIDIARDVQHLMSAESVNLLDVAERYIDGLASAAELELARVANAAARFGVNWTAARVACAVSAAVTWAAAVEWAADVVDLATDAADDAAAYAADATADAAAAYAADADNLTAAAYAAKWAADAAAAADGPDDIRAKQEDRLRKLCAAA